MNEKVKDALRNLIAFNESLTQEKSELLRQVNKSKKSNAAATKMMKQLIKEKQQWTEEKQQWTEEKKQLNNLFGETPSPMYLLDIYSFC